MKLEQPLNVLVQRRAALGDVIMTTGIARELKRKYGGNVNIDIATDFAEPYRNNPHIRNIFPIQQVPDVKDRWDMYYNLDDAYELNPTEHYVKNYFYRVFGDTTLNMAVDLFPNTEDIARVDQALEEIGNKFIVVHLRNWHWPAKNITMDVWLEVFGKLFEERADFKIVCTGGSTDHFVDHPLFYDARGWNTQEMKYLCDHAACFVGIDSGPFHCASASSTHIIGLLTHLDPGLIMPHRKYELGYKSTAIVTEEDCRGCNKDQVRPVRQLVCPKGNTPCNNNFDTDVIVKAILAQL